MICPIPISGKTKTAALIGNPIEHSLSPAMHNLSFAYHGIDCTYHAYSIPSDDSLEAALKGMQALGFIGCNVTMPYKTKVIPYLDELSPEAKLMEAVNTITFKDGKSIGYNTDGAGFLRNVTCAGVSVSGKKITIAGTGGAGYTQAALDGAKEIILFNQRDAYFEKTQINNKIIAEKTGCTITLFPLDDQESLRHAVASSTLFINATRVGMYDCPEQEILNPDFMVEGLAVADTVYEPRKTKLIIDAEAKGLTTITGLGMLLQQASMSEEIWLGTLMPLEIIEEKLFS